MTSFHHSLLVLVLVVVLVLDRRNPLRIPLLVLALFAAALPALAASPPDPLASLPPGTAVLGPRGVEEFTLTARGGTLAFVDVTDQSFQRAARVTTLKRPDRPWDLQLRATNVLAVKKGDILLATFCARAMEPLPEGGEAAAEFCFETPGPPWTKSAQYPFTITRAWLRHFTAFRAQGDFLPGGASVLLRVGYDPQIIEIGDFRIIDYRDAVRMDELPFTPITYGGREPDAPWRAAAADRIERIRKGDLSVAVRSADGHPVTGALVTARMTRHAFAFGSAVQARRLLSEDPAARKYREVFLGNFNKAVLENDLKWDAGDRAAASALPAVQWLKDQGIPVRGHCLVWPKPVHLPPAAVDLLNDPDALRAAVRDRIREAVGRFRGQIPEWDVINEPYDCYHIQNVLAGRPVDGPRLEPEESARHAAEWFRIAHEADPDARLYANDYEILSGGGRDHSHQDYYERFVRALLKEGAPVHGIGLQSHFREPTPIPRILALLDRFAALGLELQITEHDINSWDEAYQSDFTRDFMTAAFSHPSVVGFMVWGFWRDAHWLPDAAYYDSDWSLRPAGQAWRDLVFKDWWTVAEGRTGPDGIFRARGFLGDYEIKVEAEGVTKAMKASLDQDGTALEAVLSPSS
jgi:endo-1,4-beta-xylanase